MPLLEATAHALKEYQIDFSEDVMLTKRTYWRAGGSSDGFCRPKQLEALRTIIRVCTETRCPYFILGNGSNLLLSDHGLRGMVIQLAGDLATTDIHRTVDDPPFGGGAGMVLMPEPVFKAVEEVEPE